MDDEYREESSGRRLTGKMVLLGAVSLACLVVALLFFVVYPREIMSTRQNQRCANNLRTIMVGAILYSNEHRFFPHMMALAQPNSEEQVSDVFRTLVYMGYLENPKILHCSAYDDDGPTSFDVYKGPEHWDWGQSANSKPGGLPIHNSSKVNVFQNRELSYTYLRRKVNSSSARSDTMIMADKSILVTHRDYRGLINEGVNIAYGDGHIDFSRSNEEDLMRRLAARLHMKDLAVKALAPPKPRRKRR